MTITNEAKQRACDLANAHTGGMYDWRSDDVMPHNSALTALAQLCQDISDAVDAYDNADAQFVTLKCFILPKPAPDPLVEALQAVGQVVRLEQQAQAIREHLAKTGHAIVPVE